MGVLEAMAIFLSCSLCMYLFWVLIKFLHKIWWTPIRIQRVMSSQGIRGPPYRLIHGNTKEMFNMRAAGMSKPMDLSDNNIFPRLQPHLHAWLSIYGKNFLTWHGPTAHLVITESEYAKEILNDKEKAYPKINPESFVKKLLGDGLLASKGEKWAKLRKLANHAFYAESLKNMVPAMIESVEMMLERWTQYEGKEIEVFEEFRVLTSEVISRTAFGSSYVEGKSIFEMLMKMATIVTRNFLKIRFPGLSQFWKSSDDKESEKLEQRIRDSIMGIIKKREDVTDGGDFGTDLLGLLVKANNDPDENNRITVDDVVDECKTFYIAGHESTTALLAWAVLLLAINTDWQEKARNEVLELFGKQNPNAEGIARMKKMTMIITEIMRLYPPALTVTRKVQRKITLGRLVLPANINVSIATLALHLDPQIWGEDAHLFKPERFSDGVAKATNNDPGVYIPFGLGPRNCVGMNFAINEAKIALSMILQRYAFTLSPAYIHSPVQLLSTQPQHGIQVMLHPL